MQGAVNAGSFLWVWKGCGHQYNYTTVGKWGCVWLRYPLTFRRSPEVREMEDLSLPARSMRFILLTLLCSSPSHICRWLTYRHACAYTHTRNTHTQYTHTHNTHTHTHTIHTHTHTIHTHTHTHKHTHTIVCVRRMVKTECDRLLLSFIPVAAVARKRFPRLSQCYMRWQSKKIKIKR